MSRAIDMVIVIVFHFLDLFRQLHKTQKIQKN